MTARKVADYYGAVLASAGGNVSGAAKVLKLGRDGRARPSVFVRDGESVHLSYEVAAATIQAGLLASIVNDIAAVLPFDKATVLRAIGIDKATLGRRMHMRGDLTPAQAEAAFRTMELTTLATETFGTLEKAALWLKKPYPLLAGASPLDYSSNQYALAKVKSMLYAIRYGGVVWTVTVHRIGFSGATGLDDQGTAGAARGGPLAHSAAGGEDDGRLRGGQPRLGPAREAGPLQRRRAGGHGAAASGPRRRCEPALGGRGLRAPR